MKRAIVTFGTGPHAELLKIALPSYKAFAHVHGYDFFVAEEIGRKRPAPWYKVQCLMDLLDSGYDIAMFWGCDMVVTDGRDDIYPPADVPWVQAMVAHQTGDGHIPNTDMWMVNPKMRPWLDKCWALDKYIMHGWWEQAALMELMGYYPDVRPTYCRDESNELFRLTHWLERGWNVHLWDSIPAARPRIMHATMHPDRAAVMRQWATQAEEGWMSE